MRLFPFVYYGIGYSITINAPIKHPPAEIRQMVNLINNSSQFVKSYFLVQAAVLLTKQIITPTIILSIKLQIPNTKAPLLPRAPTTSDMRLMLVDKTKACEIPTKTEIKQIPQLYQGIRKQIPDILEIQMIVPKARAFFRPKFLQNQFILAADIAEEEQHINGTNAMLNDTPDCVSEPIYKTETRQNGSKVPKILVQIRTPRQQRPKRQKEGILNHLQLECFSQRFVIQL